ncbi:MAG: RNA methyltransferase [Acholeplasmatales bacterium]|nr:RNA methyltransferase [Acholeplasmatales bacterium]
MITSVKNQTVKDIIELKTSRGRRTQKMFMVEGPHLVREARDAGVLLKAYTTDDSLDGEEVSFEVMKKICDTATPTTQIGLCSLLNKTEITDRVLILDGLQDPGNVGTLLRSAASFGFNTIFFSDNTCDFYNDKVIRSSQGSIFKLNLIKGDKLEFIKKLSSTHTIYNTNVRNGVDVRSANLSGKVALILGNEGNGVSDEINELNLPSLFIQMDNMESLNVGVAGSILMYEISNRI